MKNINSEMVELYFEIGSTINELKDKVQDFIKDPYVLEFLDIKDRRFLEKDLESNLLEHIEEELAMEISKQNINWEYVMGSNLIK